MLRFGHMGFNNFSRGGGFMMIFWFLLLAAVIYFIVQKNNDNKVYRQRDSRPHYNKQQLDTNYRDSAEATARMRFAKGEISKEEFKDIIRNLKK